MKTTKIFAAGIQDSFSKMAWGEETHKQLQDVSSQSMGITNPKLRERMRKANIKTDTGIRHPWLPMNPDLHAFPSQRRFTVLRDVAKQRRQAVADVAEGLRGSSVGDQARAHMGMGNLAQTQHGYMDVGAHFDKPVETGKQLPRVRKLVQKIHPNLGFAVSGAEHLLDADWKRGLKTLNPMNLSKLDDFDPKKSSAAAKAQAHAQSYGRSSRRRIVNELKKGGLSAEAAEARVEKLFSGSKAPNRLARVGGEAARDLGHLMSRIPRLAR